jgi:hypothetical protein
MHPAPNQMAVAGVMDSVARPSQGTLRQLFRARPVSIPLTTGQLRELLFLKGKVPSSVTLNIADMISKIS